MKIHIFPRWHLDMNYLSYRRLSFSQFVVGMSRLVGQPTRVDNISYLIFYKFLQTTSYDIHLHDHVSKRSWIVHSANDYSKTWCVDVGCNHRIMMWFPSHCKTSFIIWIRCSIVDCIVARDIWIVWILQDVWHEISVPRVTSLPILWVFSQCPCDLCVMMIEWAWVL